MSFWSRQKVIGSEYLYKLSRFLTQDFKKRRVIQTNFVSFFLGYLNIGRFRAEDALSVQTDNASIISVFSGIGEFS